MFQVKGTLFTKAQVLRFKNCMCGNGYILGNPPSSRMLKIAIGFLASGCPNNLFVILTSVRIMYNKQ